MQYFSFAYIFIWVRKLDSDSLTEAKNWGVRNEVIQTSGRVHPWWPQNKRLRMLWTTDWMHTGQDRWIQTELAFTLAKNATKPNPFEIISLQTTRTENNWKTQETLARAVVTVETERIKGSNPWCLWWWWWWWWLVYTVCSQTKATHGDRVFKIQAVDCVSHFSWYISVHDQSRCRTRLHVSFGMPSAVRRKLNFTMF